MGELAYPVKIRAHHLLCLLGFRGLGYSREFVVTMGKVVTELRSDATFPIILVDECDVFCASCPHNRENKCVKKADSEWEVQTRDLAVLQRLGFETGVQIPVGKVWARITERLSAGGIAEICRGCEWLELGYCAEGLERLEAGQVSQEQSARYP